MRVLHVIPSIAPARGGPSQEVLEMVHALLSTGIDAEIVTTNDNGSNLLDVPLGQLITYQKVPIRFFSKFSPDFSALREFSFSWSLTTWLYGCLRNYDLIHVHAIFSYPSTSAMTVARLQGIPYIVSPLGLLCTWSLQQSAQKKQMYLQMIERQNLNHCKALHFASTLEQQEVSSLHLNPSGFVLPHGLNCPAPIANARQKLRQFLDLPKDETIFLFLSRLHPKKGLDFLLKALNKISHHQFTLVIAGQGEPGYEQELQNLVEQLGLKKRVRFVGFVGGETKDIMLQGADLFTLTSFSENFGIAVLEALAAGLPVLITPEVALADIVKAEQFGLVLPLEVDVIAYGLQYFLFNRQVYKEIGTRACSYVAQNYSWEKVAVNFAKAYEVIYNNSLSSKLDLSGNNN
jgi:glycosyltransferase involved in cell wall biosynthesis